MSVEVTPPSGAVTPLPASPLTLPGQGWGVVLLLVGFFCLYGPTYAHLAVSTWATDEQGHGPLIVAASAWLLWTARGEIFAGPARPALGVGFGLLTFGLLCFMVGRSQSVIELEAGSQVIVLASGLLILHGWGALKRAWFPILFLLFSVPLPGALVQAITMPLKHAVSVVAEKVLYLAGYPIGRSGVMLVIGPYQLLVADACSGLNSLFTLEALGLLYMKVMRYQSKARNVLLAVMIVPISFVSNVARVLVLVLITYHLGDESGQGFAHGFAGMVLFGIALVLTFLFDRLLAARFDRDGGARAEVR